MHDDIIYVDLAVVDLLLFGAGVAASATYLQRLLGRLGIFLV
jgi:hypothetical protein